MAQPSAVAPPSSGMAMPSCVSLVKHSQGFGKPVVYRLESRMRTKHASPPPLLLGLATYSCPSLKHCSIKVLTTTAGPGELVRLRSPFARTQDIPYFHYVRYGSGTLDCQAQSLLEAPWHQTLQS
eukprot:2560267-Amphidinium_carterae.1